MIIIKVLKADDLERIELQKEQIYMQNILNKNYNLFLSQEFSFTIFNENKQILACAGLVHEDINRAYAWILLSKYVRYELISFHRKIKDFLALASYKRIETLAISNFPAGIRWLKLLNFYHEGQLKHFYDYGQHAELFAKYNNI